MLKAHETDGSVHLDAVRGLAALVVFVSHLRSVFFAAGLRDLITDTTPEGAAAQANVSTFRAHLQFSMLLSRHHTIGHFAVIVFFVLSGYFVGGSVLKSSMNGKFAWGSYGLQRVTRLWVVLIPALCLGAVLDEIGLHYLSGFHNIYQIGGSEFTAGLAQRLTPGIWIGNLVFLQGIATPVFGTNYPLWSLSYEFWFYVLFPLLVLVFSKSRSINRRVLYGLLFCGGLVLSGWGICAYLLVWGCGAAVSVLPLSLDVNRRRVVGYSATAMLFIAMLIELRLRPNLWVSDMILGVIAAVIVWAILHLQGATVPVWYRRAAQGLSKISYTLYVVHLPILIFISGIIFPSYSRWRLTPYTAAFGFAILTITMAAAWFMYFLFERNTNRIRKRVQSLTRAAGPVANARE